jgi:hypothetical protein
MTRVCSSYVLFTLALARPGGGRRERRQSACKPGSVPAEAGDGHSSGTPVARRLARPTRAAARKPACGPRPACRPYLVLLPVGFAVPFPLPGTRCALTAPFHPYRRGAAEGGPAGGLISVALSLGSPPPGVTRHRVSVEPGLSSPRRARRRGAAIRPTDRMTFGAPGRRRQAPGARWSHNRARREAVSASITPSMQWGRKWRWKAATTSPMATPAPTQ